MSRVLSDAEVQDYAGWGAAWLSETGLENLVHSIREARRERDEARAALRDAIPIVALHVPSSAECLARWRRALGESA